MLDAALKMKEPLTRLFAGLGRVLNRKGREAGGEISAKARPDPRTPAEEALWVAMGWSDPEAEDALAITRRKAAEALRE